MEQTPGDPESRIKLQPPQGLLIGENAFSGAASSLTEMELRGVRAINEDAFSANPMLETFELEAWDYSGQSGQLPSIDLPPGLVKQLVQLRDFRAKGFKLPREMDVANEQVACWMILEGSETAREIQWTLDGRWARATEKSDGSCDLQVQGRN